MANDLITNINNGVAQATTGPASFLPPPAPATPTADTGQIPFADAATPMSPAPVVSPVSMTNPNVPETLHAPDISASPGPVHIPVQAPKPTDELGDLLKNLSATTEKNLAQYDTAKNNVDTTTSDIANLSTMLGGQTAFAQDQGAAAGLPQLNADLQKLHNTQSFQTSNYLNAVSGAESGPGGTKGYMNNQVSNIDRQHGLDALVTSALIDSKNSDITTAQAKVDRAVSLQFDPIKNQIATKLQILDTNKDMLSAADKRVADARSNELQAQLKAVDMHQTNVKDAVTNALTQVTNGNLDPGVVSKAASDLMSGKTDLGGFYAALGIDASGNQSGNGTLAGYDMSSYATDPLHEQKITNIYNSLGSGDSQTLISNLAPNAPVTGAMIDAAAAQYGVDPKLLIALFQEESGLGTQGAGAKTMNPGNVGNTDNGSTKTMASWQDGVNAAAQWLADHRQSGPSYAQYGLLANTDFNPNNRNDKYAQQYLDYYLKNATYPTASSLGISTKAGGQTKFSNTAARANQLYFDATGQSLPDVNILKANKGLVTGNNKLLNNLDVQNNTVGANFALALQNIDTQGLNQNSQPINAFLNNIQNLMGNPETATYLAQNATLQNEIGSLIAVKNASGTTVHDKLSSAGLVPKNASVAQQVEILKTLLQEAENGKTAIQDVNKELYKQIDPLQQDPSNPSRNAQAAVPAQKINGVDAVAGQIYTNAQGKKGRLNSDGTITPIQ